MSDPKQTSIEGIPAWSDDWEGMPEYIQEQQRSFTEIKIRFNTEADMEEFAKLIGQKLTAKTKSIWHPKLIRGLNGKKKKWYIDES